MEDIRSIVGFRGHYKWSFDIYGSTSNQWIKRRSVKLSDTMLKDGSWKSGKKFTDIGFGDMETGSHPSCARAGVYAIIAYATSFEDGRGRSLPISEHLLYIGSSNNVRRRLGGFHHVYTRFSSAPSIRCGVRVLFTEDYIDVEKRLIHQFSPVFNVQHNG